MRIAWLVASALVLVGASKTGSPPVIVSAYAEAGDLRFDAPIALNWDSLLPQGLRATTLSADRDRLRQLFENRSDYGTTEVPFPVPMPTALRKRYYYLLDSAGVQELRPTLQGAALIQWAGDSAVVVEVRALGGLRVHSDSHGGFVLSSEEPTLLVLEPSALSADSLLAPGGGDYWQRGTPFWQIVRQYQIVATAPSADRWVWVQWLADTAMLEAGCSYRFSLFHLTPRPVMVSSTDSGCDV